jgi:rhamnosyltransferase
MKIAAVVILYHPDNNLIDRIQTYMNAVDVLYVVDNTEKSGAEIEKLFLENASTKYFHDGENKGIAERLNQIASIAMKDGYSLLLTMDQDSYFKEGIANQYTQCISNYNSLGTTAMMGTEFLNESVNVDCETKNVSELITSGSIINLSLFNKIGDFDENLFIDFVDHEYCYRSILNGYAIIKFSNIFLQHKIGEYVKKRSLGSFKYTQRSFHSSVRLYYMVRNYLYLKSKYNKRFSKEIRNHRKSILTRIKNKLIYSNERFKLIGLILKAFSDYKNGRMGKIR